MPHVELLEFCPELVHDPAYQWMETIRHEDKISTNKYNPHLMKTEQLKHPYIGLDRYCEGARYPILSAAAIPIPGCTIFFTENAILCVI